MSLWEYSGVQYDSPGASQVDFNLTTASGNNIAYLSGDHIHVYTSPDGNTFTEITRGSAPDQWDFHPTDPKIVRFNTAPGTALRVRLERDTPYENRYTTFQEASRLTSDQLNDGEDFSMYVDQELWDRTLQLKDGGVDLDDLSDVEIASPQDLEVLQYDAASAKWKNSYVELDELSDVELASPASPEVLKYDPASSKWKNQILNADDLGDVDITSATDRSWLYYDGSNWVNGKALKSTDAWSMSDTEIATTQASDDQFSTIVSTSAPVAAPVPDVEGKSYYVDDATQLLYVWTGSAWKPVKGSTAGDTTYLDVFFVSKDNGNDSNTGHSVTQALETLDRAVQLANGDIAGQPAVDNALIYVFPGQYNEPCPIGGGIKVQNLSIVGQGLRSTYVFPDVEAISSYDPENPDDASNELKTMWACNSQ